MRLSNATNAANGAVARVREIDPNWRPRPGIYESAAGAISHQLGVEAEANARFNELRRDAIPGTSHNWGVNRLRMELNSLGYKFEEKTDTEGYLYRRQGTLEEVRIMRTPFRGYRKDPFQKRLNSYYYRYRAAPYLLWGQHTTILDKETKNWIVGDGQFERVG